MLHTGTVRSVEACHGNRTRQYHIAHCAADAHAGVCRPDGFTGRAAHIAGHFLPIQVSEGILSAMWQDRQ